MVAEMATDECAYRNSARGGVKREGLHGWPGARTVRTESAVILARRSARASSSANAVSHSAAEAEAEAEDCIAPGKALVKE